MQTLFDMHTNEFEKREFEYIVVDNDSQDDSADILSKEVKKYPGFHFIQNPKNNGFGAGNNLGVSYAKGEYILFLNNDTQIHGKGILEMVSFLETHLDVGIVGGELKNFDKSPQSSVGKFYTLWQVLLLLLGMQRFGLTDQNPTHPSQVAWVKGALMMVRKKLFEKIDGFDEKIFMYTEDMELCYRASKTGARIYFYPTDGILHKDQGSSNRTFAIVHIFSGILYFYKKHKTPLEYAIVRLLLQTKATILLILGKITRNTYLTSTYAQALDTIR